MTYSISNIQSTSLSMSLLVILLALIDLTIKKYFIVVDLNKISDTIGKNINRWVKEYLLSLVFVFSSSFWIQRISTHLSGSG